MIKLDFKGKISKASMILLFIAAAFTLGSAFAPVWRIDLTAPQYPEGMVLYIGGSLFCPTSSWPLPFCLS